MDRLQEGWEAALVVVQDETETKMQTDRGLDW